MFQFKNEGLGMKEPDTSNALPNTFGKVRTFKEDLENFEKGISTKDIPDDIGVLPSETKKIISENPLGNKELSKAMPAAQMTEQVPNNPFQSVPSPPPISSSKTDLPPFKSSPSQSFFAENKPAKENSSLSEIQNDQPALPKKKRSFFLPLIIVFLLAVAGGGFYYYWFNIRNTPPETPLTPTTPATPTAPAASIPPTAQTDSQNKNLQHLVVDTSQGPTEIRSAIQNFATEFTASASESNLVEMKLVGKDNQPIGKKEFFSGIGTNIPDTVLMKLSEDYSLFARKENGSVRLGFVFKTVTSSGLVDETRNWEPTLATDLAPLYVGQAPTGTGAFNSSRYKNADIRYFNFSSPADTSLDYSVISNFLVIGTSKETTRAILDYMSEK